MKPAPPSGPPRWPGLRFDGLPRAWLFALLVLLGLLSGWGLRDPWPPDEPRFAIIGLEFLASGNWLFPHIAGVLYPDKPPVFLWLMAGAEWLAGSMRWGFKLPSLLSAGLTLLLTYDLGRRLWSRRAGIAAATVLLLTLQFTLQARQAQIDMTLTAFTTLGLYGLCRHLLSGPSPRWCLAGFAGMAAGVLTKGVGFLPLLALAPWALARRRASPATLSPRGGQALWLLAGFGLMLLLLLAWLLPVLYYASGSASLAAYRDAILFHQTVDRYADASGHLHPWWYYLVNVIPVFWLPWSALLPWLIPAWWRRIRRGDARYWVLLGWIVLVLGFFMLSTGKRNVYLLPATPALALCIAPMLRGLIRLHGVQHMGQALVGLVALLTGAGLLWACWLHPEVAGRLLDRYDQILWPFLAVPLALAAGWAVVAARRGCGFHAFVGLVFTLWAALGWLAAPAANSTISGRGFVARVESALPTGSTLAMVGWAERYYLYLHRPFVHFGHRRPDLANETREGLAWVAQDPRRRLLVPKAESGFCVDPMRAMEMGHHSGNDWWLVGRNDLRPECATRMKAAGEPGTAITAVPAQLELDWLRI